VCVDMLYILSECGDSETTESGTSPRRRKRTDKPCILLCKFLRNYCPTLSISHLQRFSAQIFSIIYSTVGKKTIRKTLFSGPVIREPHLYDIVNRWNWQEVCIGRAMMAIDSGIVFQLSFKFHGMVLLVSI